MNKKIVYSAFMVLLVLIAGCGKDNYDEPESVLTGHVVYQGQALQVRGTDEQVRLQFYQDGYAKHDPIDVFITQDGSFTAKLFDGTYKAVTKDGNGPWVNSRDTTVIEVHGNTTHDFEVTPFFTIADATISLNETVMDASFTINQVVESATIGRVFLLLNTTSFVDEGYSAAKKEITEDLKVGKVNFSLDFSDNEKVKNASALFGRVCVQANGADQGIYSPVVRLR
ncbi:DUF3823 domain-containing protein [Olivibacter ginsenosidimutans]|uniref:DUF3823 domain-containing protein n=1 Tax=Olivibacter ginsenosidimutans TaxID=1176537 RepID=A0ABP9BWS6_9SPHI